jgi:hypothetical protein
MRKGVAFLVVVIILIAIAVMWFLNRVFQSDPVPARYQAQRALIRLAERVGGLCSAPATVGADKTERVVVKKKGSVIWLIDNGCRRDAVVRIDNFKSGDSLANPRPIEDDLPNEIVVRAGNRAALVLTVALTAGHPDRDVEYTYEVWVNGARSDPFLRVQE